MNTKTYVKLEDVTDLANITTQLRDQLAQSQRELEDLRAARRQERAEDDATIRAAHDGEQEARRELEAARDALAKVTASLDDVCDALGIDETVFPVAAIEALKHSLVKVTEERDALRACVAPDAIGAVARLEKERDKLVRDTQLFANAQEVVLAQANEHYAEMERERDTALRACAEKNRALGIVEAALRVTREWTERGHIYHAVTHALSSDAGRGYLSPAEADALAERVLEACATRADNGTHSCPTYRTTETCLHQRATECVAAGIRALDLAALKEGR